MEVTAQGTSGSAPSCPQAVSLDCCSRPHPPRGGKPDNSTRTGGWKRGDRDGVSEEGVCKERPSEAERCRGKGRRTLRERERHAGQSRVESYGGRDRHKPEDEEETQTHTETRRQRQTGPEEERGRKGQPETRTERGRGQRASARRTRSPMCLGLPSLQRGMSPNLGVPEPGEVGAPYTFGPLRESPERRAGRGPTLGELTCGKARIAPKSFGVSRPPGGARAHSPCIQLAARGPAAFTWGAE